MTIGQINAICWTIFIAMCVLFAPALLLAISLHSVLLAVAFVVLWWAPFGYGMYIEDYSGDAVEVQGNNS